MAIAYSWRINQLDAKIEEDGVKNVIYDVHYTYIGTDLDNKDISSSILGVLPTPYDPGKPFVPWADDQAFENVVIGWLNAGINVTPLQESIAKNINEQINPVDEKLYFTFNNSGE
jgi:hypothetical protein